MSVTVIETLDQFKAEIAKDQLTIVDFWATWCGPCIRIAPFFKQKAAEETGINFCKVDVDENDETAGHVGIKCMPTFKFYKGGNLVETLEGASQDQINNLIAKHK